VQQLAGVLSRERLMLELLLFKFVTLRQLLLGGEARFLSWAAEEVDRTADRVRAVGLERSLVLAAIAAERGVDPDELTLEVLSNDADEPWRTILTEQRRGMMTLTTEIEEAVGAVRRLASQGAAAIDDLVSRVTGQDRSATKAAPRGAAAGAYASGEPSSDRSHGWSM
jgi:hypothetical protein